VETHTFGAGWNSCQGQWVKRIWPWGAKYLAPCRNRRPSPLFPNDFVVRKWERCIDPVRVDKRTRGPPGTQAKRVPEEPNTWLPQ